VTVYAPTAMLEVRGVIKRYGDATALGPIDLTFAPGTTALIGPSGCGKSTLLRVLIGLVRPDAGEVRFDGAPLTEANLAAVRQRIGYVIQDGGLFPHLTAADNVALLATQLGWAAARVQERRAELARLVRLDEAALARFPQELSGGQRQRVSLMRALMLDPDVLLLDEPMGALDPMIRADLQADLKEIFTRLGKIVVLVTHDLAEAGLLSQRIALLRDGQIVQLGPLAAFYQAPGDPFVTRFVRAQTHSLPGATP
jgi:osmoprotectant transport system ATP-binding protein